MTGLNKFMCADCGNHAAQCICNPTAAPPREEDPGYWSAVEADPRSGGDDLPKLAFHELPDPFFVAPLEWIAKGLVCHPTHGELAGAEKSLKSYVGLSTDAAAALGVDVLGRWRVPEAVRVLNVVGEGGERGYLRRLERIAAGYGATPGDVRPMLRYTTQTMPVSSPRFIAGLSDALDEFQPRLVRIDPWYSYAPTGADARNLYEVGYALERIGALVRTGGATLIINNHFNQTGTGDGLRRITMAGHAEWCDSWWLLSHREKADVDAGRFRLRLDVGSRQWGGATFDVDFDIGRYDHARNEHVGSITWEVNPADRSADRGVDADEAAIGDAMKRIVKAWMSRRDSKQDPWAKTDWLARVTGNATTKGVAFEQLADGGRITLASGERGQRGAQYRLATAPGEQ